MNLLGDYTAEFKRGPDKRPRKKRGAGLLGTVAKTTASGGAIAGLTSIRSAMNINNADRSAMLKAAAKDGIGRDKFRSIMSSPSAKKAFRQNFAKNAKSLARRRVPVGLAAGAAIGAGAYGLGRLSDRRKRR